MAEPTQTEAEQSADPKPEAGPEQHQARRAAGHSSPHRLFALADGVFAISMTLLALDVRIPDDVPHTVAGYHHAAGAFYANFGIFMLAFVIAGRFWLANHRVLATLHTVDNGVLERTVVFLAGICTLPVATAVLFRFGGVPQAVAFASLLLAVTSLLSARLYWYLSDPKRQLSDENPANRLASVLGSLWNTAVFLLAIPVAYLLAKSPQHNHVGYSTAIWVLLLVDDRFGRLAVRTQGTLRRKRAR